MTQINCYLEDLKVGDRFSSDRATITESEIKGFASQFDPQPFHLNNEVAKETFFKGLAASGWHTAAIAMRLLVESEFKPAGGLIGAGVDDLKWHRPVRVGDRLTLDIEIVDIRPSKSKPNQGIVRLKVTTLNQKEEEVLSYIANLVLRRSVS